MILFLSPPNSEPSWWDLLSYRTLQNVENPIYGLKSWQWAHLWSHTLDLQSGLEANSCLGPDVEWDAGEWLFWRTESVWRIPAQKECKIFTPVYQQFNLAFFYHIVLNETLLTPPDRVPTREWACPAVSCRLLQHTLFFWDAFSHFTLLFLSLIVLFIH